MKPDIPATTRRVRSLRNPGPSWGYPFLRLADRVAPEVLFKPLRAIGTAIAMAGMPEQRRCSREYLGLVLGRRPTQWDVWRHFFASEESLMDKLRAANGAMPACAYAPGSEECGAWLTGDQRLLLGTFHVGSSDLTGFLLGGYMKHPVYLVRLRVGNSHDTDRLAERFGGRVRFVWVNDPQEILYALKDAASGPSAIALQCDRMGYSARAEAFEFLGARRLFPVTIYHLALIFGRSVILSVGLPGGPGVLVHASPVFTPQPGEPRMEVMRRAHAHFQAFLCQLEGLLRQQPFQWFNFTPLNPVAPAEAASP